MRIYRTHQRSAHYRVQHALRSQRLPHPNTQPCAQCGKSWHDGDARHEYAHDDYNAPLAVRVLCAKCHRRYDGNLPPPGVKGGQVRGADGRFTRKEVNRE